MKRKDFLLGGIGALTAMGTLSDLKAFSGGLKVQEREMPSLFIGHGSPMNGIESNEFSESWAKLGTTLPLPKAVIVVSAHWYTQGTRITAVEKPETIYDFYGFPQALYEVKYPAPGDPQLAATAANLITKTSVTLDHEWGLDHGTWTIVRRMYPEATIPVLQLSIDYTKPPQYHYELAAEFKELRKKGVLIMGSGNMVHNLRMLDWQSADTGYDWALQMNDTLKKLLRSRDHKSLIDYDKLGASAKLSIPTPEHYLPMLYIAGLQGKSDEVSIFNDKTVMGSVSMTSFLLSGEKV